MSNALNSGGEILGYQHMQHLLVARNPPVRGDDVKSRSASNVTSERSSCDRRSIDSHSGVTSVRRASSVDDGMSMQERPLLNEIMRLSSLNGSAGWTARHLLVLVRYMGPLFPVSQCDSTRIYKKKISLHHLLISCQLVLTYLRRRA